MLHSFRVIPDRGSWYEAQFDTSDLLYVYLDRKKRRRKFLTTTFFRALSFLDVEGGINTKSKDNGEKTRGEDNSLCILEFENGAIGLVENSWSHLAGMDDRIEIHGSTGMTYADLHRGNVE